jgi:hypothetical protein
MSARIRALWGWDDVKHCELFQAALSPGRVVARPPTAIPSGSARQPDSWGLPRCVLADATRPVSAQRFSESPLSGRGTG